MINVLTYRGCVPDCLCLFVDWLRPKSKATKTAIYKLTPENDKKKYVVNVCLFDLMLYDHGKQLR